MIKKVLVLTTLALSTLLNADYILEYQMGDDTQKFMYHDASSSKLVNGDGTVIYKMGAKTFLLRGSSAVDMADMRKMADSFNNDSSQNKEEVSNHKLEIKKSSKRVVIAGIKGEEWIVSGSEDGEAYREKVVVTKDKRVVESVRAMSSMFNTMGDMDEESLELEKGYVLIQAMEMKLKSFKDMKVDKNEYKLPKNTKKQHIPTADEISNVMQKAIQEHKSRERTTERTTDKNQNEEVDKAVNMLKSFL